MIIFHISVGKKSAHRCTDTACLLRVDLELYPEEKFSRQLMCSVDQTGSAVLDVETIRYPVSHDICQPINEDRVDSVVNSNTGQLNVVCIR